MNKKQRAEVLKNTKLHPKTGRIMVDNWDGMGEAIVKTLQLYNYRNGIIIQKDGNKWKVLTEKEHSTIARFVTQLHLNFHPTTIMSIAKHTANLIPVLDPKLKDHIIYFKNGEFNIKTGKFTEVETPEYNHRRLAYDFKPFYECKASTDVMTFLNQFQAGDDHKIARQIAEMIGACLVPTAHFRKMFQLYGNGYNGKSEIFKIMEGAFGKEMISNLDMNMLTESRAFSKLPLVNKAVNIIDELERTRNNGISTLKTAASGGTLNAEIKGGKIFQFQNEATIMFGANFHLDANDGSNSVNDRLQILNFIKRFKDEKGKIEDGLMDRSEYLNDDFYQAWLSLGAQAAYRLERNGKNFTIDKGSYVLEEERKMSSDTIYAWLFESEWVPTTSGDSKQNIYNQYSVWCEDNGRKPESSFNFGRKLILHFGDAIVTDQKIRIARTGEDDKWVNAYKLRDGQTPKKIFKGGE